VTQRCGGGAQAPWAVQVVAESVTHSMVKDEGEQRTTGPIHGREVPPPAHGTLLLGTATPFPAQTHLYPPFLFSSTNKIMVNTLLLGRGHRCHPFHALRAGCSSPPESSDSQGWQSPESAALSLAAHPSLPQAASGWRKAPGDRQEEVTDLGVPQGTREYLGLGLVPSQDIRSKREL